MTIERARGNDPYDALRSARVPGFVRRWPRARQLVIQLRKRSPLDLAGVLGVSPFFMAKTLASFAIADARLVASGRHGEPESFATALLERDDVARGGDGSWGYEFDVQTRWAFYPAFSPNLIATVFCARGLATAGLVSRNVAWVHEFHSAATYLRTSLLTKDGWFRYTPDSSRLVHNANLLGAGVVAASGRMSGDEQAVDLAVSAALVSVAEQDQDGGWPYGVGPGLSWRDNFHTAYNLDALLLVWLASADPRVGRALSAGAAAWADAFFDSEGAPAYYAGGSGPRDIHSAGTAIDVASRLAQRGLCDGALAPRVAEWTHGHLVSPDGTTYYAERNGRIDRRHFVRWGDGHLAIAQSSLALTQAHVTDPLEAAIEEASR